MNRRFTVLALCLMLLAGMLFACAPKTPAAEAETSPVTLPAPQGEVQQAAANATQQILALFLAGNYQGVLDVANETLAGQLTAAQLEAGWASQGTPVGAFVRVLELGAQTQDGMTSVQLFSQHENGQLLLTCSFDEAMRLGGVFLKMVSDTEPEKGIDVPLPTGATEQAIKLHPNTNMALDGAVVLPANYGPHTPAVVFAHGSGSSDMDETLYTNKPFRDIAYGLAAQGIASIRYDKLSFAHPELFGGADMTADLEYTGTVLEALRVLRETAQLGPVYLAGHSLGGMLTPYLIAKSEGGFAGGVILAGTPRKLWEASLSQNNMVMETLSEEQRAQNQPLIDAEVEKAHRLLSMSDEDALATTVFGMPAYYLRHMEAIDTFALVRENNVPLLILQGEADFQVSMEEDFAAWQAGLAGLEGLVTYRTYPGLSHLFMKAQGSILDIASAYGTPDTVDPAVIADIAEWINAA